MVRYNVFALSVHPSICIVGCVSTPNILQSPGLILRIFCTNVYLNETTCNAKVSEPRFKIMVIVYRIRAAMCFS